ncbi:hypothetical protein [Serratia ureilytica]|uniref:hypothetical protein n=1 Tax=Serratia ureilytica TaxID=300181 RepID=UPI001F05E9E7|nr:hypothetical protein [Serratia ureilytica]UMK52081.1 hypothetical protein L2D49_20840 [Serratia ureilytica]
MMIARDAIKSQGKYLSPGSGVSLFTGETPCLFLLLQLFLISYQPCTVSNRLSSEYLFAWRRRILLTGTYNILLTGTYNAVGNFAVRAHVICSDEGSVSALLTLRKGWYKGEYTYASPHVVLSCKHTERRKAYRLASQHAKHLARLRYRF